MNEDTPPTCPFNSPRPASEGWHDAKLDFSKSMSYGDYLQLDTLLAAQKPLSGEHDEMLFIIQHHTSELWMKLALHELRAALLCVRNDELDPAFKMLSRVKRIFEQIVTGWNVLATLTPSDYTLMRGSLGSSSGFQSHQYREIEFRLGNKNEQMLKPHAHRPELHDALATVLAEPSLYDEAVRLLARRGFEIDAARLERDWTGPTVYDATVEAAWLAVYREPRRYWDLYQLAEDLVDIEDRFRQWRFRHVTTVERIIGFKTGTGGTSGATYLRKMLDVVLFPELWQLRTQL
ncbi:tryptophan 2,3-dioxygenase [Chitinasiproducens palmae]|uniref:Tryptophan 2,3-dioxygenase n=1 Tax=Chitinasiproducens palmae TaxID=1770053 RepID=A0A1H2PJA5_9BURK|nr:tryptophan 2,3-dioxygenase [Chitinasiproducens palmae]SDV46384.1 tryptophan 2,3-dioxygenase [Chitinasiproducens palmae]